MRHNSRCLLFCRSTYSDGEIEAPSPLLTRLFEESSARW